MSNFGLTPYKRTNRNIRPYTSLTNTLFNDDFFRNFFSGAVTATQINIDVKDNQDKYVIEAELPGVKKEDKNIDIDNGVLTLSTKVQNEKNEENDNYVYRERRYGSLCRSFSLDNIDDEKIKAKYEDGILVVELPKKEPEIKQNRTIEIK